MSTSGARARRSRQVPSALPTACASLATPPTFAAAAALLASLAESRGLTVRLPSPLLPLFKEKNKKIFNPLLQTDLGLSLLHFAPPVLQARQLLLAVHHYVLLQ